MTDHDSSEFYKAVEIRHSCAKSFHMKMRSLALSLRRVTGQQFGIPRFVASIARWFPATDRVIVAGPDGKDFIVLERFPV